MWKFVYYIFKMLGKQSWPGFMHISQIWNNVGVPFLVSLLSINSRIIMVTMHVHKLSQMSRDMQIKIRLHTVW